MPESFAIAQELADEPDPRKCVVIDDLPRTTRAALEVGMARHFVWHRRTHRGCQRRLHRLESFADFLAIEADLVSVSRLHTYRNTYGIKSLIIAALLFILLIVGINFAMYAIARGATKNGDARWMSALRNSFSKPMDGSTNKSMDELRKKMEELEEKKKEE